MMILFKVEWNGKGINVWSKNYSETKLTVSCEFEIKKFELKKCQRKIYLSVKSRIVERI